MYSYIIYSIALTLRPLKTDYDTQQQRSATHTHTHTHTHNST